MNSSIANPDVHKTNTVIVGISQVSPQETVSLVPIRETIYVPRNKAKLFELDFISILYSELDPDT